MSERSAGRRSLRPPSVRSGVAPVHRSTGAAVAPAPIWRTPFLLLVGASLGAGLMLLTRQAAGYDSMGTLALKTTAFLCAVVVVFGAAGLVAYILRMRRYRNTTLLLAAASDALPAVQLPEIGRPAGWARGGQ